MKKKISLLLLIVAVLPKFDTFAQADKGFGIGIMLGEPTGISWKVWLNHPAAIDGGLTWSLNHDWIMVHADYLYHFFDVITIPQHKIALYLGGGGWLFVGHDPGIGARVPLGIDFIFDTIPLDLFFEIVPAISLLPDPQAELQASIGIRFFFK